MADKLRVLYDALNPQYNLGTFEEFKTKMSDENKRKAFYDGVSPRYELGSYDEFNAKITPSFQPPSAVAPELSDSLGADSMAHSAGTQVSLRPDSVPLAVTPPELKEAPSHTVLPSYIGVGDDTLSNRNRYSGGGEGADNLGKIEFDSGAMRYEPHYYTQSGKGIGSQIEPGHKDTPEGNAPNDQLLQREFDEQLSSLWERHNPEEGLNAAEEAWSAAEERQKAARNRNAEKRWNSYAAMGGGREMRIVNTSMNRHDDMVDRFTNFDLDRLMNDAWDNLGEEGQKSLIDDCYQMFKRRNPGVDELVLYDRAKEFARQQSNLRLYTLAVERNMPKDNLEYLMRKIGDANLLSGISKGLAVSSAGTTGDMAAYEAANEQYRQDGHKVIDVVGTVSGMALDPTMWISGGVGSAAAKGAMWAGGRYFAGRGATAAVTNAATRQFATSMTGRIVAGAVGGAANFGSFEGLKEAENQFAHGGHIVGQDESGRYINEGYSAGAVGRQALHGLLMGGAIGWLTPVSGNVSDKLVRGGGKIFGKEVGGVTSTAGKVATRAGVYTGATIAEGTIFSAPEWISGKREAFDVWTDNMAMMVGFKAKHMLKSTGGVLSDLKASFDSPANGSKNRLDFESRLRMRMDAPSDGGLALTKDERAELKRYGYDLRKLVESAEATGNAKEGGLIAQNAPEIVSRLTDMVQDSRVSEAARAKMYYYATGRMLPMSTIMRGEIIEDGNGGFIVESQGANGVITSRSFKNRKAADLELQRINRQTELNHIELGERYQQTADFEKRLQEACRKVAAENGWDVVEVYRTCEDARRNHLRGGDKQFGEAQQNILRKVTDAMGEFEETGVTDAMRGSINEKYGVNIDAAIRREPNRRTKAEQAAIDEYIEELIPRRAKARTAEDVDAEDITNQKRLASEPEHPANEFDGGEPRDDADPGESNGTKQPIGRAVMKFEDRPVEVLSGRVVMTDDGTMVDSRLSDNSIVIRDLETGKVEMISPEAILSYEEYAPEPVVPDTEQTIDQQPEGTEPTEQSKYASGHIKIRNSDGSESRGVLTGYVDEQGKYEYYVEGDLQHLHYATESELDNILSDYQPDAPRKPEAIVDKPADSGTSDANQLQTPGGGLMPSSGGEQAAAVPITPETVPNSQETAENTQENAQETPESVPTPSALSQIPHKTVYGSDGHKKEVPDYTAVEPGLAWDGLVESAGDDATAQAFADNMVSIAQKSLDKAKKAKSTPTTDLDQFKKNEAERKQAIADAQKELDAWQKIAGVDQERQAAIRAEQEAEARRLAAERAEKEKEEKAAREEAERIEREALNGIPEWHMDTPENARTRGNRRFSGQLFTRQEPVQGVAGKEVEVKFSQNDLPEGRVTVIEASQLQPSHIQGRRNPMFFIEEAQPKNRSEAVSANSARQIAEDIRPEEITGSVTAYTGAPTVNTRGEVIQGNNRSDALRYLWENDLPQQQATYKQYLLDNAEKFGLDPDAVNAMHQPVLVNMLDVEDAEAIRLGQMTAQDTESGGIERIKPKNVAQKLGENMRQFANMLLRSGDEETSFGQLVDRNGIDVLKWMNQIGAVTNTQYQSAFDSKGNLTAEAKNDLQKVLYQAVFKGGSQQLEEMFDSLPYKAQRAILATAFRDMDSPIAGKLLPEIQASIAAYNQLMSDLVFAEAKKMEEVLRAVEAFKSTIALDDRFEQYSPADNFSNFALHLAAMYKASDMSQSTIAGYFTQMYDLAQGKKEATLFEEADTTEYPLADVIKKVLNIDYQPAKNGNNNVANGGADVALLNQVGQGGELRGNEPPASGEQTPAETEPSDRRAGASDDSRGAGDAVVSGREADAAANQELGEEVTPKEGPFGEIYTQFKDKPQEAVTFLLAKRSGEAIGALHHKEIGDIDLVWGQEGTGHSDGFGLAKLAKFHPEVLFNLQEVLNDMVVTKRTANRVQLESDKYQAAVRLTWDDKKKTWLLTMFEKKNSAPDNTTDTDETLSGNGNDTATPKSTVISSETPAKTEPQQPNNAVSSDSSLPTDEQSGTSSIEPNGESTVSNRKDTQSLTDEQIQGEESSSQSSEDKGAGLEQPSVQVSVQAASAEVDTNPTEAQKKAGNYKKGHVTIGAFDITIENPAGSVRKGVDANGNTWETTMANTYGYIKGTESVDGDHIDVFLADDMDYWNARRVFVIDQTNEDGSFDEHKVMLGFNDAYDAMQAYLANYDPSWREKHPGLRISGVNIEDFNKWIQSSHRKTKPFADYKNINKEVSEAGKIAGTNPTEAQKNEGFTIEARKDTRDNSDIYAVKFEERVSRDEFNGQKAIAKKHGGYWSNFGKKGFLFKSEADAKAFAAEVMGKSEDDIADQAPLSMTDMGTLSDAPVKKVDLPGVAGDLHKKGEAKLSDHAEPIEQPKPKKRSRWISDDDATEFNDLRNNLRSHLGTDSSDLVQEDAPSYGKLQPKQMDVEVLRMGTRMTYLMMKGGLRKFSDYAEAMVEEVGDAIRPHLKSLYAAAQNMEEVIDLGWDEEMDDRKTVKAFDVYNFDKPGAKDFIETAQHIVDEQQSQKDTNKLIEGLTAERNEKRRQREGNKPYAPVGQEDYISFAERISADEEAQLDKAEIDSIEARVRELAHTLDFDGDGLEVQDLTGALGELQTMWEGLTFKYGEEPADANVSELLSTIENEMRRWRKKEIVVAGNESAKKSVPSQNRSEVDTEQPMGGLLATENIKNQNDGEERNKDTRRNHSESQSGRERLSSSEQVGSGTSVQNPVKDSGSKRGRSGIGGSKSGARPEYDVNKDYSNEEIHEIASSVTAIKDGKVIITGEVTDDLKSICRQYKSGGIAKKGRGVLDEYYTDGKIVDAVRVLIAPYFVGKTARVLEPSVGIGNFAAALQGMPTSEIVAFEINETTARIAKMLHPEMEINLSPFETQFIDDSGKKKPLPEKFHLVIGNPPYGSHRGLYKGLGEESKIARYEDYFVKRSLDVLEEGGVLAMVLPSSWLDRYTKYGGYTVEVAYRLPSGAFESTQVGTDIVVLKKDSSIPMSEHAPYFEQYPDNICGDVKQRKGRFGKLETYVEGNIDVAIENIERENAKRLADKLGVEGTSDNLNDIQSAIDETGNADNAAPVVKEARSAKAGKSESVAPAVLPVKSDDNNGKYKVRLRKGAEVAPTSKQFHHEFSEGEVEAFEDTNYDGTLDNPSQHWRYANYIGGKAVHDFYYAEGDIYSKLEQLEQDKRIIIGTYGEGQYEKQRKLLESVLPKRKGINEITISPNTTFVKNLRLHTPEGDVSLRDMFIEFCRKLPPQAFGSSSSWEVNGYVRNEQVYGQDKHRNQLVRERRKRVANDLFVKFLTEEISETERVQIVYAFNREYNSTYRPDYSKVPMFSTINKNFKGRPLKLTSVQLAGVGRMTVKGVGVLAHEVGFGKTLSGVLAMHEAMSRGFAKKPLIVVPNDNILKQWVETIGEALPEATINTLGNLGSGYDLTDFHVNDFEFTIVTYEGLKAMSFSDETYDRLSDRFSYITEDLKKHKSERDIQKEKEKRNELKGKMMRGAKATYRFEDFGFDYLTFDEVHNANHIVSKVRLDKSVASDFRSQSQRTSDLGLKTWLAAQYIQEMNNGRNVLLLSATPFTNKPLEYYSILSLVGNDVLRRKGFFNIDQFFATFMEADNELEIGANGRPVQKTNVRKFRNNGLFQQLLSEFIDIKGEEDNPDLERPERLNREYKLPQNELTAQAIAAVQNMLSDNETVLQGIGHARAAAFSPYATSLLGLHPKDHKDFVGNSPKIDATVKMIERNIKDRPDAGQIVYSEVGVEFFPLIRDYLVKESGLAPDEVRIITGATSNADRINIQTAFNKGEVKVVIGSPAIKEGLNLQENTTDMYILSLPWNFTQLRQIEGRGWRQGNRWKNIRINYMLTDDSVDVFMLQRLQTKQGLYNEAMKRGAESVDVSDIDTSELKTSLITDPSVRAEIVAIQERAKLDQEKVQIEADQAFMMRKYKTYNELMEGSAAQRELIARYEEYASKGGGYWSGAVKTSMRELAAIEQKIEQEKQRLRENGINVDDIARQIEHSQNAIKAIDEKIENLKDFERELADKYRQESRPMVRGAALASYLNERMSENQGGFYSLRKEKDDMGDDSASEPVNSYNSRKSANFASRYETQDGQAINYSSENPEAYGGLFDFDFSSETEAGHGVRDAAGTGVLQLERNPDRSEPGSGLDKASGEFAVVERVFTETGSFNFTSGERIESADDVAFIFSALEDKAKEHSFVVLVKNGKPTVVELGMGTFNSTMVDVPTASLALSRIHPDEVYFVHNHPSGNLICSPQDVQMLKKFEDMCDVPVYGVIINLKTGHYGTFDTSGDYGIGSKRTPGNASPLAVHTLDKQIFAASYDPMMQPQVRNSADVASFLNSHRMGDRAKVSFLILSRANKIVGNIHTPYTSIPTDADEMARYISERVIQFGGENAIVYGDFAINRRESGAFHKLKQSLQRAGNTNLLDVVTVEGNHTRSANDEGLLYEPGSEYGASQVSNVDIYENPAESRTIPITSRWTTDHNRVVDAKLQQFFEKASSELRLRRAQEHRELMQATTPEAKRGHAEDLAQRFNTPIRIVEDVNELMHGDPEMQKRMRASRGFYDPASGEVVVVVPNNATVEEVAETVFHEVVAHKGLRDLIGEENYDAFCDEVYDHLKDDLKQQIDEETTRRFINEPGKGYAHHRRVAVDEMFGRMSEKGFEDFSKAERGIWAKLKATVLDAINKFLGSLKLPKWVKLGDNELRYMLWKSHENLRTKGDYVGMARDVVMRTDLKVGSDVAMREELSRHKKMSNNNEARLNDLDPAAAEHSAKVVKKIENVKNELRQLAEIYRKTSDPKGFLTDLGHCLGAIVGKSGSGYRTFELVDGSVVKVRISTHNINSENAHDGEPVVSIVIKPKRTSNTFVDDPGKIVSEFVYFKEELRKAPAGTLSKIAEGMLEMLDTGTYKDKTGLARENRSSELRFRDTDGETGDIWKDRSVGLEERLTNAAIRLSNNQAGDLTLRNDAMKAVTNNLQSLLKEMRNRRGRGSSQQGADHKIAAGVAAAMNAQAVYDRSTVKRVADLARILIQHGYLNDMTSGEVKRLLSVVKNATGMHDPESYVEKILDIMIGNQLRNAEAALSQLLAVRGSKVDARGVEVQGMLDVDGQRTMEVVKKAMTLKEDDINDRIAEALNRMSDTNQTIAYQAAIEYVGLNMALDYVQNIAESKAEEKALRDSLTTAKEDRDAGRMTDDAFKQYVETTEDAIRKNKIERAEAYFNLVGRLSDSLRGSIENAKAFRESEKSRIKEIHHNANSDMEGRPTNEHHKESWQDKVVNNGFVQFLFSPLATFDQVMRVFGNKSANGEGYLWNRFMRGWVIARNKELTGVKEKFAQLDDKAAELFGQGNTWGSIIRMEGKLPKASVSFWDGGEMRDHELTQGNLLYIYMVDKMADGRMKLRRMGITEQDIVSIENFLDPRFKALGDWLQDEFLVATRNEYNETHKRMFGAGMAAIENYFPLKILANARIDKEEDVNQPNRPDGITTKTGSIIKRRVNNLALDITGADALSVILDHITQMEHWNAYAEWNRDLNTLRTYKRFRNQVINMTTVYGGGRKLWENFNDLCLMAAGEYRPPIAKLDKSAVNIAKGVTAAKVSFRMFTALKQLLSAPAYAPEVSIESIDQSLSNPYGDFKWCMDNLPIFRERWHSRISGDPRLLKNDKDWNMWRSRIMEICSRIGMTPNAFVDAVTVSIGARAMYETRLKQYQNEGYPTDAAEERAKQDAAILFNQTQQSSESPFLSTMQVDRSWLSVLFTVFRNSAMSYTRQEFDAIRNLKRNLTPGQRAKSVEFMTKQILRDWNIDPENATYREQYKAEGAAENRFRRQIKKDIIRVATFGFILEFAWNLGAYLPYIIFGNDEDEKDKMWDDATTHALFGGLEGLTGGDVLSSFGNMAASGEWSFNQLTKDMPMASDINSITNKFIAGKNAAAINDIIFLIVQSGIGMNPQSITDAVVAFMDACGDDPVLCHEAAIFVMRVLQVPQSQIDKMYFDEIGLSGEEASKLTPTQLAQRYAEYKVKRGTPLAPWSWDDEDRLDKAEKVAEEIMKERLESQGDAKVKESYADFENRYKAVSEKAKKANALMKIDYAAAAQAHASLQQEPDFGLYQRFGSLDKQLARISKLWLSAKSPEEAALVSSTIQDYRAGMVKVLQAETEEDQQSAMSGLTTLMNEFYAKYQAMHPHDMQVNR